MQQATQLGSYQIIGTLRANHRRAPLHLARSTEPGADAETLFAILERAREGELAHLIDVARREDDPRAFTTHEAFLHEGRVYLVSRLSRDLALELQPEAADALSESELSRAIQHAVANDLRARDRLIDRLLGPRTVQMRLNEAAAYTFSELDFRGSDLALSLYADLDPEQPIEDARAALREKTPHLVETTDDLPMTGDVLPVPPPARRYPIILLLFALSFAACAFIYFFPQS